MSIYRYYSSECNFVLSNLFGEINDGELAQHVSQFNKESEGIVGIKELADCREIIKINLSVHGTTLTASHEQNKPGSNLAILVPENNDMIFAMARAYQMFAEDFRESVKIFKDYNEALNWLTKNNVQEINAINEFIKNT